MLPNMAEKRPVGWLIEVRGGAPGARRGRFAVLAENLQRAKTLVRNHVGAFSQRIELQRILADDEVHNLVLKPGEVRDYGPKAF
jgi:hypothetical protein